MATSTKRCNNLHDHSAASIAQGLQNALMANLREKINDGRDVRCIIKARRRDQPDRYHDTDDSDRFPAFTSNITDHSYPQ
jgi:hypothetical protein